MQIKSDSKKHNDYFSPSEKRLNLLNNSFQYP